MKSNKCKLCGWKGKTHLHHIVPLSEYGSEELENIIEICPNHHSEATEGFEIFNKRFNLIGKRMSKEKLNALSEFTILFLNNVNSVEIDCERLNYLSEKYGFDRIDAVSFAMGLTKKRVIENYLEDKDKQMNHKLKGGINK